MALGSVRLFLKLQSRKQFSFLPLNQESKRTFEMLLKANGPLIEGIQKGGEDRRGAGGREWCGKQRCHYYIKLLMSVLEKPCVIETQ